MAKKKRLKTGEYITDEVVVTAKKPTMYEKRVKAAGKDSKRYRNLGRNIASPITDVMQNLPGMIDKKDSLFENLLEYTPILGNALSIDDTYEAGRDMFTRGNKQGYFNNSVDMMSVLPFGKLGNYFRNVPSSVEKVGDALNIYGVGKDIYQDKNLPFINEIINYKNAVPKIDAKKILNPLEDPERFIETRDNPIPNVKEQKALGGKITNMKKKNLKKYGLGGLSGLDITSMLSGLTGNPTGGALGGAASGTNNNANLFGGNNTNSGGPLKGVMNMIGGPLSGLTNMALASVGDMVKAIVEPERERRPVLKNPGTIFDMGGMVNQYGKGGTIKIKPSKKGTFTAAAKKRGKGVQEFASQVLANKDNYSPAMVKKANFARNASKWKHAMGGLVGPEIFENGGLTGTYMDAFDAMAYGSIVEPENKFNTRLNKKQLQSYQQHSELFPSLLNDKGDYDTQGFYKNLYKTHGGNFDEITKALTPGSETEHIGTDKFKKPNHPTFSKESKYYIPLLRNAGTWEDGYFNAVNRNINNMNKSYGSPMEYMKYAEDYNQNSIPDIGLKHKGKVLIQPENQMAYGGMIDPSMYMQQMMYGTYAQGGQVPQNVPVEVEGQEMYEMPNGETGEFQGPSHENGGIPISLPEGTKIYSDRLKINGKTMADRKEKRENNIKKLEKLLTKNPNDRFIKESLKRQQETAQLEEAQDMQMQEQANQQQAAQEQMMGEMLMGAAQEDIQQGMMAMGGMIKRADGSYSQRGLWDNIRDNRGSGKKPTKEMLAQEKKIRMAEKALGGLVKYADGTPPYGVTYNYPTITPQILNQYQAPTVPVTEMNDLYYEDYLNKTGGVPGGKMEIKDTMPFEVMSAKQNNYPSFDNITPDNTTPLNTSVMDEQFNKLYGPLRLSGTTSSNTETPESTTKKGKTKKTTPTNEDYNYTEGDRVGRIGTMMGMFGPTAMTLLNRLETPKNINFFNTFGQDALRTQMEAEGIAGMSKDEAYRKNLMRANALRSQLANTARGVNDKRMGYLASALQEQEGARGILANYLQGMSGLKGQRAQLQQQIDQTRMGGEQQRDLADRQDVDNFYTNLAENLASGAGLTQKMGRDINIAKRNKDILSLSKYYSKFGVYADYDDKGNLVLKYDETGEKVTDEELKKLKEQNKTEDKKEEKTESPVTTSTTTSNSTPALDFYNKFKSLFEPITLETPSTDFFSTKKKKK